ncbi:MAG: class I SAM-dependent methyltransferase [Acidobacteria bacterium]|jgi:2-polyprenyl-3-methyl-5-hydroxy-6-metoxy-1,4-benzoquinol methylase|nr:class I SAM-dependent methyltransferase [Acidobacteriota bacterium]
MADKTREPQYQMHVEFRDQKGLAQLGLRAASVWEMDPRRLAIVLSRYKFVSKMLSGKKKALEVGCGDAFGTRIVQQEVGSICGIDFDEVFIRDVQERMEKEQWGRWNLELRVHDMLSGPVSGDYDCAYSLDVLEHISKTEEDLFMKNLCDSVSADAVVIIGMPSLQSQEYASEGSKAGHVNCKDGTELKTFLLRFFHNVFVFSMNDEVVHTGFYPMAHYLFGVCVGKK